MASLHSLLADFDRIDAKIEQLIEAGEIGAASDLARSNAQFFREIIKAIRPGQAKNIDTIQVHVPHRIDVVQEVTKAEGGYIIPPYYPDDVKDRMVKAIHDHHQAPGRDYYTKAEIQEILKDYKRSFKRR